MNVLFLSKTLLLISPFGGFATLIFLFIFCFFLVHFCLLANVGWKTRRTQLKKQTQEIAKKEEKAPTPKEVSAQEPIYYIVERKRTRARPKTVYSEPKQIRFK